MYTDSHKQLVEQQQRSIGQIGDTKPRRLRWWREPSSSISFKYERIVRKLRWHETSAEMTKTIICYETVLVQLPTQMDQSCRYSHSFRSRWTSLSAFRCGYTSSRRGDMHINHAHEGQQRKHVADIARAAAAAVEQHNFGSTYMAAAPDLWHNSDRSSRSSHEPQHFQ